jgi:hypothetical protein
MKSKGLLVVAGLIAIGAAWYVFRPERLFISEKVNEGFPASAPAPAAEAKSPEPAPLFSGRFHGVAHETMGTATIYQLPDGKRVLRLTEFKTSNGPDVQLYLVAADDAKDNDTVKKAGFVTLGALKGNEGDQNYDVPAEVDLAKYRAVTVWCRRFGVNFATAPLTRQGS